MTNLSTPFHRRTLLALATALSLSAQHAWAQAKQLLRISTPAVPDDWHAKMWTVMKEQLDKTAPGKFDVQINLNASLFKQGAEPVAMARGNLELATISSFDIAKLVPEFSIFTAKFYEVTKQLTLTSHLVDALFIAVSNKLWATLSAEQKAALQAAAQAAAKYNNENRIADELQLLDFFKTQGLTVSTPDVAAFRKAVQATYLQSDYAKLWPTGLLERINATPSGAAKALPKKK